jgi:hypothetical protein
MTKMSRRQPTDTFTRFTSNSIHASKKPSLRSQRKASAGTAAAEETPAEKVARLRAELRSQRGGQLSTMDKIVAGGRRWADGAHRITTFGLLGLTGISAVFATYGIFSLVVHSRRQKRAFIDSEMDRLRDAQQAFLRGEANAEQLHLLEQERAGEAMAAKWKSDREHQKTLGLWARVKSVFSTTASKGDMGTETPEEAERREHRISGSRILEEAWTQPETKPDKPEIRRVAVTSSSVAGVGYDAKGRPVPVNKVEKIVKHVEPERRSGERLAEAAGVQPGPLDQLANNVATAASPSSNGWFGGWFGKKG